METKPETTASFSVAPGSAASRFRLLEQWEKIEEGDEMLDENCETWSRVPLGEGKTAGERWMIGCRWNALSLVPFRRPLPNDEDQGRGRTASARPVTVTRVPCIALLGGFSGLNPLNLDVQADVSDSTNGYQQHAP